MPILIIAFVIQTRMAAGGSNALKYVVTGAAATKSALVFFIVILITLGPTSSILGEILVSKILYARHSGGWEGWALTVCLVISLAGLLMLGILLAINEAESDPEPGSQSAVIELVLGTPHAPYSGSRRPPPRRWSRRQARAICQ